MKLAVFDLDETLTRTGAVDDRCFRLAWDRLHGPARLDDNWLTYSHQTDRAIYTEACERALGRWPDDRLIQEFIGLFLSNWQSEAARDPAACLPLPGAARMLDRLAGAGWLAAVATGGWGRTARFKLSRAGLARPDLALASADDGYSREEIVNQAIARTAAKLPGHCGQGGQAGFKKIVCLGDGIWDVATARNLGLAFVGVLESGRLPGAATVVPDYSDLDSFLELLEAARPPDPSG